ncbi:acylphosphatase [Zobellella iuensis]|uniref:acylphosphatase n=1 Tax=Zobellella iuensis TaxID=2803811 RepID=A0ABS1QT35_9GAMM|nr:acylphosphatase [Zobellella iuensis]MBL1377767.1 acylphosphatase [Zobellella iuensis]
MNILRQPETRLFERIKNEKINSSSLCCHAIMLSALSRGLSVTILSSQEISNRCEFHGLKYRNTYHQVGHVFEISDGKKNHLLNKSKFFHDDTGFNFSKKNIKDDSAKEKMNSPKGVSFKKTDFNSKFLSSLELTYPLVLKPLFGSMGRGVYTNIKTPEELENIVLSSDAKDLLVEEHIIGDEYRIYMVAGKLYGSVRRNPVHVIGNGKDDVESLINKKNKSKKSKKRPLINTLKAEAYLSSVSRSKHDIPPKGELIKLSDIMGRSSGGDITDTSDSLPEYIIERVDCYADMFSKNLCIGLDVIGNGEEAFILEVNRRPQLSSLLTPDNGVGKNIADAIVEHLYPNSRLAYFCKDDIAIIKNAISRAKRKNQNVTINNTTRKNRVIDYICNDEHYIYYKSPLNINRLMLYREANERGFSITSWKNKSGSTRWSITGSKKSITFRENMPSITTHATRHLTNNKEKTKNKLIQNGIKCPNGIIINPSQTGKALEWFESQAIDSNFMAVVKPFNGSGGRGVISKISDKATLKKAIKSLPDDNIIIEEHMKGSDHRLFVVNGKFHFAIKRHPAHIVGDGVSSIEDLVKIKNKARTCNPYTGKYPIILDESTLQRLQEIGYNASAILNSGEKVYLQTIANIGAGGDSEDITEIVHPEFIKIAEAVHKSFEGLAFCGIDLITDDISQPAQSQQYAVIEVNANCDLAMHHFPTYGSPRNAAGAIIDSLSLGAQDLSILARKITIYGKVQGVGFRRWMLNKAKQKSIRGYVKNLSDGRVEAVVFGTNLAVNEIIRDCHQGCTGSSVSYISIEDFNEETTFDKFNIR